MNSISRRAEQCNYDIEVLALRPLPHAGNLKAFASVRVGDVIVHDCRVVQQPNQRP